MESDQILNLTPLFRMHSTAMTHMPGEKEGERERGGGGGRGREPPLITDY